MFELIDTTPGSVPTSKGIFRTRAEAYFYSINFPHYYFRIDPHSPGPDDVLFEISGDDSGRIVEIPRDICGMKSKVSRIIDGEVVVLVRIGIP